MSKYQNQRIDPNQGIKKKKPAQTAGPKETGKKKNDGAEKGYYVDHACEEEFVCRHCGKTVKPEGAGTDHRNHCPNCLYSLHLDNEPGDRASDCGGKMEPIAVWVRKGGEWALIHRCTRCGALSSNRIAADDNPMMLMSIAMRPISQPPFPLERIEEMTKMMGYETDGPDAPQH